MYRTSGREDLADRRRREARLTRRQIIPNPYRDDAEFDRFHHRDLTRLSAVEIWAEQCLATAELARMVFERRRPRVIFEDGTRDSSWLRDRLARLDLEAQSRRSRTA